MNGTTTAANLNGAAVHDDAHDDENDERAEWRTDIEGVRVPTRATHWRCYAVTLDNGRPRYALLSFGVVEATGEHLTEWPIAELRSLQTIVERWGAGDYEVRWIRRNERDQPTIAGRTKVMRLAARTPAPSVAPPAPASAAASRHCEACGAAAGSAARYCATCGHALAGGAPAAAPIAAPVPPSSTFAEVFAIFNAGQQNAFSLFREAGETARAEAAASAARYRADVEATLERERLANQAAIERERMAHERHMRELAATYARAAESTPAVDVEKVVRAVERTAQQTIARLEERIEELEEEIDDAAPAAPAEGAAGVVQNVQALAGVVKDAGPPVVGAIFEGISRLKGAGGGSPAGG